MPTTIRYADILNYLTAIANKANNPIGGSPHGEWWSGLSYNDFKTGQVPNMGVPIMDTSTPLQSPFYVILTNPNGAQGNPQMPGSLTGNPPGPFITDAGYTATLSDGTTIAGATIQANIESWLSNGYPE
jgi:hypothetical protein